MPKKIYKFSIKKIEKIFETRKCPACGCEMIEAVVAYPDPDAILGSVVCPTCQTLGFDLNQLLRFKDMLMEIEIVEHQIERLLNKETNRDKGEKNEM